MALTKSLHERAGSFGSVSSNTGLTLADAGISRRPTTGAPGRPQDGDDTQVDIPALEEMDHDDVWEPTIPGAMPHMRIDDSDFPPVEDTFVERKKPDITKTEVTILPPRHEAETYDTPTLFVPLTPVAARPRSHRPSSQGLAVPGRRIPDNSPTDVDMALPDMALPTIPVPTIAPRAGLPPGVPQSCSEPRVSRRTEREALARVIALAKPRSQPRGRVRPVVK